MASTLRNSNVFDLSELSFFEAASEGREALITEILYFSQSFTTTSSFRVDYIECSLRLSSSPGEGFTNYIHCDIYAADGNSKPTGSILKTATLNFADVGDGTDGYSRFNFGTGSEAIFLTTGTKYCIVLRTNKSLEASHGARVLLDSGGIYAGVAYRSLDSGDTWDSYDDGFGNSVPDDKDLGFRVYGFEPEPLKAISPTPVDEATGQPIENPVRWLAGDTHTDSFDVYFEDANPPTVKVVDDEDVFIFTPPADLAIDTDYYWRVDARNAFGTTTGDIWKFTTSAAIPVSTPAEFQAIKDNPSASYYLINDIDMVGESYTPIGNSGDGLFTGEVDGRDFTVSNITIDTASSDQGVFDVISSGGYVHDLKIVDVDITANARSGGFAGKIAGGTVINCSVTGTIDGGHQIGGFVGYITSTTTVQGCSSEVAVTSSGNFHRVGGFVGQIDTGTIETSYATGNVSATDTQSFVGGFLGYGSGVINNCYATGDVIGNNTNGRTGGFVGTAFLTSITNSYSTGAVSVGTFLGGFAGRNIGSTISDCYYDTTTSGQSDTGKGIPKITAEMKQELTFDDWDFLTPVWYIIEDDIYPIFDTVYGVGVTIVGTDENEYVSILEHVETDDTIPITGVDWETYWLLGDELMVRMIPFIFSSSIAYECEFGGSYIRFFFNGEALMDNGSHVEVVAPYLQADLFSLHVEQVGDVMWITHPSYAQRKLSRVSATEFSLDVIEFNKGPFLLRNDFIDPDVQDTAKMSISGLTIATATAGAAGVGKFTITSATDISALFPPNKPFAVYGSTGNDANFTVHATEATTYGAPTVTIYVNEVIDNGTDDGKILVVGATDTLVSTGAIFDDADHVGALFKLVHPRLLKKLSLSGAGTSKAIEVKGTARFVSTGTWKGTWRVQRNQNSSGWEEFRPFEGLTSGARNDSLAFTEKDDNVFYRLNADAGMSTGFGATLTVDNPIQEGIVKVVAVTDENNVTVEIIKLPASTIATRRWAEGAWSPLRGYPASVTFSRGNRCVYAGESPIVSQILPD
jgi:hypothetical protein